MTNTYADVFFPSADGRLQLYARDYAGAGPCLLMLHGLTRNSADFAELAEHFAGRYRVVVPDQRGRGRSQYDPDPAKYTPATYCGDMLGLIARLKLERPVLLGTSMGGLMAMIMGAMAPAAYRGIVLNDVGPVVDAAGIARISGYVGNTAEVTDWAGAAAYSKATNGSAFPHYSDADWDKFAHRLFREDANGVPRLAYDPAIAAGLAGADPSAVPPDLWPMWGALATVPILAIRGECSDILNAATLAEMGKRHPGMKTAVVAGVGHAPMLDEPEAVEAIERFVGEVCGGA
ncbi:MAG: putative hydrolase [Rhodanobacteraceae bacterium]|jgi:pimeloyl-ACP methyl ester carboxylesterase|nr:MAG: putative hydrolase [Rhodanobacteraceae bacterium]